MRLFIRKLLQKVGYDIVKYHQTYVAGHFDEQNLQGEFPWLKKYSFKTILDIGANEGQFADKMHALFPQAIIYSFEPIPEAFTQLQKNFQGNDQVRGINLALGDKAGEIQFNKNESMASSSFLEMADTHKESFDFAVKTEPITVKTDTLDSVMKDLNPDYPMLVKIDVQGFEDKVIQGGVETLKKAAMVLCEVSFVELYKNQKLFDETYRAFTDLGFIYAGNMEQLRSPDDNRILQADAIFINQSLYADINASKK